MELTSLQAGGYDLLRVGSGEAALKAFRENRGRLDLALIAMDLEEGLEAAKAIALEGELPLLFLAAPDEKDIAEKTAAIPNYGCVVKGSAFPILEAAIRTATRLFTSERELRERESKLFQIADNVPAYISLVDEGLDYLFVNKAYEGFFKMRRAEIVGRNVRELLGEEAFARAFPQIERALKGEVLSFENFLTNRLGESQTIQTTYTPYYRDGRISGLIVMVMDISERKRLENALRESENRFRSIFENAPLGLLQFDEKGKILAGNNQLIRIVGSTKERISGFDLTTLPDEAISRAVGKALSGSSGQFEGLYHSRDSETATPVRALFEPVLGTEGAPHGGVGIIEDITERSLTEEALRKSEEQHRHLIENSRDIIYTLDAKSRLSFVSPAWTQLLGHPVSQVTGLPFETFVHPDDLPAYRARLERAMETGESQEGIEYRALDAKGGWRWHSSSAVPIKDEAGATIGFEGTARDISANKEAEDKIKELLAEKELILKEVHHRIKNNMSVVSSLLSIQAEAQTDPVTRDILQDAMGRLQSMGVLYDKLYRSENSGEISLRDYLPALIDEIARIFDPLSSVRIETRMDDIVLGERILSPIGIIINELVTNSMKYAFSRPGEGLIRVTAERKADGVRLVYEDNGKGIPETVSLGGSQGFGLLLVESLTAQIKGSIAIDRGQGARFTLDFPA